ncbi:MAG: hypothetical protein ACR2J9_09145 [Gaiellales bacterium]
MSARRGQAVVELLAVAPLIAACCAAFAIAAIQLSVMARAEAALSRAVAADAAGGSIAGALAGRARLTTLTTSRITVEVHGPLGIVRRSEERVR